MKRLAIFIAILSLIVPINVSAAEVQSKGIIEAAEHDDVRFDADDFAKILSITAAGRKKLGDTINSVNDNKTRIPNTNNISYSTVIEGIITSTQVDLANAVNENTLLEGEKIYVNHKYITGVMPDVTATSGYNVTNSAKRKIISYGYLSESKSVSMESISDIATLVGKTATDSNSAIAIAILQKGKDCMRVDTDGTVNTIAASEFHNHVLPNGTKLGNDDETHEHLSGVAGVGGCYTTPVYHRHSCTSLNADSLSGDNNIADDATSSTYGGCYTTPVYHHHSVSTDTESGKQKGGLSDTYKSNTKGGCYTKEMTSNSGKKYYLANCGHIANEAVRFERTCGKTRTTIVNSLKSCSWTNHEISKVQITFNAH